MKILIMIFVSTFFLIQPNQVKATGVFQALKQTSKAAKEVRKNMKAIKKYKKLKSTNSVKTNTHIDPSTYFYFYPFVAQPLRESSNLNERLRKQKNDKCIKVLKTRSVSPIYKKPNINSAQIGEFSIGEKVCLRKQYNQWIATNYGWVQKKYTR